MNQAFFTNANLYEDNYKRTASDLFKTNYFRMKRISCFICLITIVIIFYSCSDKKDLMGKWHDNIKLSTKAVEFGANTDSVTITTKGDSWWVTDVTVNNERFNVFESINTGSEKYSIKKDCFVVERRDKNTLFIKADENPNNVKRIIKVELEAGDYFDGVTITQAAK